MDAGHKYADDALENMAKQLAEQLDAVGKRVVKKIKKYLLKHKDIIDELNKLADDEEITDKEYEQQMINRLTTGKEWSRVRDDVAKEMGDGQEKALIATAGVLTAVYLFNRNNSNKTIESVLRSQKNKIVHLPRFSHHDPITPIKLNRAKNYRWHRRKVESVVRQGMKRGHSVDKMAKEVERVTNMDKYSAIRTVRTAVTAAENMARVESFADAAEMGIDMRKQWYATKDTRTRSSHRAIDGENVAWDEYFSNGLFYPADPYGEPAEVYNCRCTLLGEADGISLLSVPKAPAGMGRFEWVGEKPIPKHYDETKSQYNKRVSGMRGE